ncbi:hypothetical protein Cpha266_2614 [Chlorobium phaeobacteroides DSM 266]|uniref:Uncharacterized protein n=1 Tax=Chlorobium phaeobacteroides (strain DSM 266 / SMG 266 / 2430) TaxID=290317 RepID=A1BJM4_CHLPD|nr:hypothetical protein Cpha266_2614 [Chlorobium phaeobacteroides DSM 266]
MQRHGQKVKTVTQQELSAVFYRLRSPARWLSLNLGISKAGENQLPIPCAQIRVNSRANLPLHPNSFLNQKTRLDVGSAKRKQQTALILFS